MVPLFDPLKLKDVTLRNRIAVSPMCQYSAIDGFPTDWHFVHLGSRAVGGAGLVSVEATAVTPDGRISLGDAGIWSDDHVAPFARIARFVQEQGAVAGIQLAHAGRKASAHLPWVDAGKHLEPAEGAWPIMAPSAIPFGGNLPIVPREMTLDDIRQAKQAFVAAARRALAAGFRWLELHYAHGYLAHSFFSPISNQRTDDYGGSFDNRSRFLLETFAAVREVWPGRLPLTVRLGVTDWVPGGITVDESIELIRRLKSLGLDLIDVSHGFSTPDVSVVPWGPGFMIPIAGRIRREANIFTAVGWMITEPEQANAAVRDEHVDLIMLARAMLRDPYWPFHAAQALGVERPQNVLPVQYASALKR